MLTAKEAPYFDAEINAYIERAGVRDDLDSVLNRHFEHRVIQYHWSGTVRLRVEGRLDEGFFAAAMKAPGHQRGWETTASQALAAGLTWRTRRRRRHVEIPISRIVKPEYEVADHVLERKIYRLGEPASAGQ